MKEMDRESTHGQMETNILEGGRMIRNMDREPEHGQGIYTWSNGDKYTGGWKDDKKHGQGTRTWASLLSRPETLPPLQTVVEDPMDGLVDHEILTVVAGHAILALLDGGKYTGEWKNDERNGLGTYTWTSGDKYIGGWKYDNQNGQ